MFKKIIMAIVLMSFVIQPAYAVEVGYHWTAPTTGSDVIYYEVQIELSGGEWIDSFIKPVSPSVVINQEQNSWYRIRVRGVDEAGHAGEWSIASEPYNYTAPGSCGQPER